MSYQPSLDASVYLDGGATDILAFFYVASTLGLGLFCVGLVITAVGLGSKGFHSPHLTLLGPALIVKGEMYRVSPKEGD